MRRRMGVLMMTLLLAGLTGCGRDGGTEAAALHFRTAMLGMGSFSAQAEVTADYGDRVYCFTVESAGSAAEGSQTIRQPENLDGVCIGWQEGGATLTYDTVSLELGAPDTDGLSPSDAMPVILAACCSGAILETGTEQLDGVQALYLLTENPLTQPEDGVTVALWAHPETNALLRAEIRLEGTTVITYTFSTFEIN